ncbi:zona pellucida sperm-binding protein 1-like [Betta splendens]|uniref:Zona pellucida sperm-binding protein 4 n=1 Tax=Betta splendens TaxID=158456 RepID=A0A9W2XVQ6_BETSP|nr:zona pellucida sperm-binding protein 1-like [Betta splendens]
MWNLILIPTGINNGKATRPRNRVFNLLFGRRPALILFNHLASSTTLSTTPRRSPTTPRRPPTTPRPQPPPVGPQPPYPPPPVGPQPPPVGPQPPYPPPPVVPQPPPVGPPPAPVGPTPPQPQPPLNPTIPPPQQPNVQSCAVAQNLRVPCGVPGITADACTAISCCFDGQQCYYGKAVTVQCTKDAQFIVVVARDATLPNINLETISLLGGGVGCTNVDSNLGFAIYQFPVTACGTTVTEEPGIITYVNKMSSLYEVAAGPYGSITRDTTYELIFQCRYIGSAVETVIAEVLGSNQPPLPVAALGPITVQLRLANGHCTTKGCNEVDVAYNSFYADTDYPITKVLRDPVYVEVRLTQKTDPNLILTLGRCWTTTTPIPHSLPQWDILTNGCPYQNDQYLSTLVPVGPSSGVDFPTHYRRFIFQMFTFVDPTSQAPLQENVYIHCSTAVCTAGPGNSCEPTCARKRRHLSNNDQMKPKPHVVVSVGPMIMAASKE